MGNKKSFSEDLDSSFNKALGSENQLEKVKFGKLKYKKNVRHASMWDSPTYDPADVNNYDADDIEDMRLSYEYRYEQGAECPNTVPVTVSIDENGDPWIEEGNTRGITGATYYPDRDCLIMIVPKPLSILEQLMSNSVRAQSGYYNDAMSFIIALADGSSAKEIAKMNKTTSQRVIKLSKLANLQEMLRPMTKEILKEKAALALCLESAAIQKRIAKYIHKERIGKVKDAKDVAALMEAVMPEVPAYMMEFYSEGFDWDGETYPPIRDEEWYRNTGGLMPRHLTTDKRKSKGRDKAVRDKRGAELIARFPDSLLPDSDDAKAITANKKYKLVELETSPHEKYIRSEDGLSVKAYLHEKYRFTDEELEQKEVKRKTNLKTKVSTAQHKEAHKLFYEETCGMIGDFQSTTKDNMMWATLFVMTASRASRTLQKHVWALINCESILDFNKQTADGHERIDYKEACTKLINQVWMEGMEPTVKLALATAMGTPDMYDQLVRDLQPKYDGMVKVANDKKENTKTRKQSKEELMKHFALVGSKELVKIKLGHWTPIDDLPNGPWIDMNALFGTPEHFNKEMKEMNPSLRDEVGKYICRGSGQKIVYGPLAMATVYRNIMYSRTMYPMSDADKHAVKSNHEVESKKVSIIAGIVKKLVERKFIETIHTYKEELNDIEIKAWANDIIEYMRNLLGTSGGKAETEAMLNGGVPCRFDVKYVSKGMIRPVR